jgi:hypothetical protein
MAALMAAFSSLLNVVVVIGSSFESELGTSVSWGAPAGLLESCSIPARVRFAGSTARGHYALTMLAVWLILLAFLVFAGLMIWRMEYLRRQATDPRGVVGTVLEKRFIPEHVSMEGVGSRSGVSSTAVPDSYALFIRTATEDRELIVDKATFDEYEAGYPFPHTSA